jgi:hypothetical protein
LFKPIDIAVDVERRTARLTVPGVLDTAIEPIKNPVTGLDHRARIDMPMGREYHLAEVASGTTTARGAVKLDFAKAHAHLMRNTMTSAGPQR